MEKRIHDWFPNWNKKGYCKGFSHLHGEWFVIPFKKMEPYMERALAGGKKSIPYFELATEMIAIKEGGKTGLDFLEFIRTGEKR